MTRIVDTSAWIELAVRSPLVPRILKEMPKRDECVVPTVVQFELAKWLRREAGQAKANRLLSYTLKCQVIPLDTSIALRAANLSREHKLSIADAIIYATAVDQGSDLLTCDAHFEGLENVVYLRKAKG